MRKVSIYSMLAILLFTVTITFPWTFTVTNLTLETRPLRATYAGEGWAFGKCFSCCEDNVSIRAGETVTINAYGCLLTGLHTPNGSSYTSSGQRSYDKFYIIGPIDGSYRIGRKQYY